MIVLTRVDHRLLHGQVVFTWIQSVGADCILVASDAVAGDKLRMSALRLAKPDGVKLVIKGVDDSIAALNSGVTDKYRLLIICETVDGAYRLAKAVPAIKEIDLGGVKAEEGKRQISKAVSLSDGELAQLEELESCGVDCYVQMVPSEPRERLDKLA